MDYLIQGHEQNNHEQEAIDKHLQDIDSEIRNVDQGADKRAMIPKDPDYKFNPNGTMYSAE